MHISWRNMPEVIDNIERSGRINERANPPAMLGRIV